jgi:16S rRNA (cytosine967-C5)-methyltransferase
MNVSQTNKNTNNSNVNKNNNKKNNIANVEPLSTKEYYDLMHLIKEVLTFKFPTDMVLSKFFREHKTLSAIHKNIVAETIYGLLRNYYKLTKAIDKNNIHDLIGLVWVKILQLPVPFYNTSKFKIKFNINYAALAEIDFSDAKFLNEMTSRTELPQFIIDRLLQQYSEDEMLAIADAMQARAGLDLRVNIIKSDVKTVFNELQQENSSPQLTKFSPYGIRLMDKTQLARHKLFLNGTIEVQDESSQIAGMLLNPKRGDMIVDFCAGGGGKTLLLGMLMRNTGRIYAFDVNEKRLNNLAPRLQRSGLSNIHAQLINNENDTKVKRLYGKVDRVFVDAPCSGFGTLRRNPELKFRQTDSGIDELNVKQRSILSQAAKLLKINGYLVYATCSILQAENQDIITDFLNTHPDFKLIEADSVLHMPELKRDDGFIALLPNLHNTDGFFAALLQKVA